MTEPAEAGSTLARHPAVDRTPPEGAPSPTPEAAPVAEVDDTTADRPSPGPEAAPDGDDTRDDRRPARGYSWPPFQPGHTLSLHHGAHSPRTIAPLAEARLAELTSDPALGHVQAPHLRPVLAELANAEARVSLLTDYLGRLVAEAGELDPDNRRVGAALRELDRAEKAAGRMRDQLGLTPLARARLGRDVAQGASLVELMSRMAGGSPAAGADRPSPASSGRDERGSA